MNTITKVSLGVLISLGIISGAGYYIFQKNTKEKELQLQNALAKIQTMLPVGMKQSNVLSKGILDSSGVYKITFQDESKTITPVLTINYKLHHGLTYLLKGKVEVEATTNLDEMARKNIDYTGSFMTTKGEILKDGSFKLNSKGNKFIWQLKDETIQENMAVEPFTTDVNFNKNTGEVKTNINFPSIQNSLMLKDLGKPIPKYVAKNTKISYDFNVINQNLGNAEISIDQYTARMVMVSNIKIGAGVEEKNNKYNIKTNIKMNKIQFALLKDEPMELEASYSINNISKESLDYITAQFKEPKENSIKEDPKLKEEHIRLNILKMLKDGMNINIEKVKFKNKNGLFDANVRIDILPVAELKDVSLAEQTNIIFSLYTEKKMSAIVLNNYKSLNLIPQDTTLVQPEQKFNLITKYNKGNLVVNDVVITDSPVITMYQSFLKNMDKNLGVVKPEAPPIVIQINPVVPQTP